ncbi:MAG: hypothetical protein HY898_00430 [Deltaproteobacteria bacterium]|nr:hypothetical protein [Deltaproteobacteria bacterium]
MNFDNRTGYDTRAGIFKLLSDDEATIVHTTNTAARLSDGAQFLDLESLDQGVQRARGTTAPLGRLLARTAVREKTWNSILLLVGIVP